MGSGLTSAYGMLMFITLSVERVISAVWSFGSYSFINKEREVSKLSSIQDKQEDPLVQLRLELVQRTNLEQHIRRSPDALLLSDESSSLCAIRPRNESCEVERVFSGSFLLLSLFRWFTTSSS